MKPVAAYFFGFLTMVLAMKTHANTQKPRIAIIATGGTIAGVAAAPQNPNNYNPGELMVEAVLKAVPELPEMAEVIGEQLRDPEIQDVQKSYINVGSFLITEHHRLLLARQIAARLQDPKIDGVIVTHGTDTLEETAFFLSLTVNSKKPVVLVGAVRPSNFKDASDPSKKPDGPQNILDAVKVIATTQSMNKGTMVVMGGQIHSAYDVVKTRMVKPTENLSQVTPFSSPNFGILGTIKESRVIWVENHPLLNDIKTLKKFDVSHLMSLPLVPILYGSAGTPRFFIDAIKARPDVKAVVVVGTGEGSLDPQVLEFVQESQCLNRKNEVLPNCQPQPLQFVRSARAQTGYLRENYYFTRTVGSGTLTATKAQILTQLLFAFWPDHSEVKYESFREAFVPFLIEGKR